MWPQASRRNVTLESCLTRNRWRAGITFLRLRLARALYLFDDSHLGLRPRLIFQERVETREVVVRLRVVGVQPHARLKLRARSLVVLLLQIERAEGDVRVGVRGLQPDGVFKQPDGA